MNAEGDYPEVVSHLPMRSRAAEAPGKPARHGQAPAMDWAAESHPPRAVSRCGVVMRPENNDNPAGITDEIEIVRAVYTAFARRDIEAMLDYLAPDCELSSRAPRGAGREGPYRGHEGMRAYSPTSSACGTSRCSTPRTTERCPDR